MAKYRGKKSSGPDPMNLFVDLCTGAATALIARSIMKADIARGEGDESYIAASMVFGSRRDAIGFGGLLGINSALNSSNKKARLVNYNYYPQIEDVHYNLTKTSNAKAPQYIWREHCDSGDGIDPSDYETADDYYDAVIRLHSSCDTEMENDLSSADEVSEDGSKKYAWRKYCPDGTIYGLSPEDYETADEYHDALSAKISKESSLPIDDTATENTIDKAVRLDKKYIWRKYCSDGRLYGINPEEYETADDYEEALQKAIQSKVELV